MQKITKYNVVFNIIAYFFITISAIVCTLPFLFIISGSLSDETAIEKYGYRLWPTVFSTSAYESVFKFPKDILNAYSVTTFVTVVGTVLGLYLMAMAGYVLSRPYFKYRNKVSFFIYFTTLFGGGVIPWYIMYTKYLNMKDTYSSLIVPGLMSPFLIILMRTFIQSSLPNEIVESAKIDGAGEMRIFTAIAMPVMKPGLATVGLFLALGYWNDWYLSSLFITTPSKYELQFYLYEMINSAEMLNRLLASGVSVNIKVPTQTVKMAMSVVVTGPILLLYPFVQKYFVKGIMVGAVKG
jgi:putative aldouronate transport system permease protein